MYKLLILLFTLTLVGCLEQPKNKSKTKVNNTCTDTKAPNYLKSLPCQCPTGFNVSADKKSCTAEIKTTRNCTNQPANSTGGYESTYDQGITWDTTCQEIKCNNGYMERDNQCIAVAITRACSPQPINSAGGFQISYDTGIVWSTCNEILCNSNYTLVNSQCVLLSQTRSCSILPINAIAGIQITQDAGNHWGDCQIIACSSEYLVKKNQCVKKDQSRSCLTLPANAISGIQSSNDGASSWGSCNIQNCQSGYTLTNNQCLQNIVNRSCIIQPANSTGGTETSYDTGINWNLCDNFVCNSTFTKVNNQCVNSHKERSCLLQPTNSFGGIETSDDGGVHWDTCKNMNCNAGYTLINNQCSLTVIPEIPITDFSYYLGKFSSEGNKYYFSGNVSLTVVKDSSLNNSNILGLCVYSTTRYIAVNQQWWESKTTTNNQRQYVIFHELGHCVLDRAHKTDTRALTDYPTAETPASMMYPSMMSLQIYQSNMEYYHHELFDETISSQNIPLYYVQPSSLKKSSINLANALTAPIEVIISKTTIVNGVITCVDSTTKL